MEHINIVPQNSPIVTHRSSVPGDYEQLPQYVFNANGMEAWNRMETSDINIKPGRVFKNYQRKVLLEKKLPKKRSTNETFLPSISVTNIRLTNENTELNATDGIKGNFTLKMKSKPTIRVEHEACIDYRRNRNSSTDLENNVTTNITDETKKKVLFIEKELARIQSVKCAGIVTSKPVKKSKKSQSKKHVQYSGITLNSFLRAAAETKLPNINPPVKHKKRNIFPNTTAYLRSQKNSKPDLEPAFPNIFKTKENCMQKIAEEQKILIEQNKKLAEENRRLQLEKLELLTEKKDVVENSLEKLNPAEKVGSNTEFTHDIVDCLKLGLENYPRKYDKENTKYETTSDYIELTSNLFTKQNSEQGNKKWQTPVNIPLQTTFSRQSILKHSKLKDINSKTQKFVASLDDLNKKIQSLETNYLQGSCGDAKISHHLVNNSDSKSKIEKNILQKHNLRKYKSIEYFENPIQSTSSENGNISQDSLSRINEANKSVEKPLGNCEKHVHFNSSWIKKVDMNQYLEENNSKRVDAWLEKLHNITDNQKLEKGSNSVSVLYQNSMSPQGNLCEDEPILNASISGQSFEDHVNTRSSEDKLDEFKIDEILSNANDVLEKLSAKDSKPDATKFQGLFKSNSSLIETEARTRTSHNEAINTESAISLNLSPRSAKLLENPFGQDLEAESRKQVNFNETAITNNLTPRSLELLQSNFNANKSSDIETDSLEASDSRQTIHSSIEAKSSEERNEIVRTTIPNPIKLNFDNQSEFKLPLCAGDTLDRVPLDSICFSTVKQSKQVDGNLLKQSVSQNMRAQNEEMCKNLIQSRIIRKKIFVNPKLTEDTKNFEIGMGNVDCSAIVEDEIQAVNEKLRAENKMLLSKLQAEESKNQQLESMSKKVKFKIGNGDGILKKSSMQLFNERKAQEFIRETKRLNKINRRVEKVINQLENSNENFLNLFNKSTITESTAMKKRAPLVGVYNAFLKTSSDDMAEAEKLFKPMVPKKTGSIPKLPNIMSDKSHGDDNIDNGYFKRSANFIKMLKGERNTGNDYFSTEPQKRNFSVHINGVSSVSHSKNHHIKHSDNLPQIHTTKSNNLEKYSKNTFKNKQYQKFPSIYVTELKNDQNYLRIRYNNNET